jgi:hypothetical protein
MVAPWFCHLLLFTTDDLGLATSKEEAVVHLLYRLLEGFPCPRHFRMSSHLSLQSVGHSL